MEVAKDCNSDSLGIANIAKSVTTLAKAVADLQKQMKGMDQRLSEQESTSSLMLGNNARKKKNEFLRAYKAVVSIAKALKVMPEIKEYKEENHSDGDGDIDQNDQVHEAKDRGTSHLLRSIAQTLSDMETVASYVTQEDDVSTAEASTLSARPADYVKMEERNGIPNNVNVKSISSPVFGDTETLKQILNAKDEQMLKLMEETKLQTQLLRKKNSWWGLANLASMMLLFGGMYIGNNYDFHQNHLHVNNYTAGKLENDEPVVIHNSSLDKDIDIPPTTIIKIEPIENDAHTLLSSENIDAEVGHDPLVGIKESSDLDPHQESVNATATATDSLMEIKETSEPDPKQESTNTTGVDMEEDGIVDGGEPISISEQNTDAVINAQSEGDKIIHKRGWLEENLCDELSDMMMCNDNIKTVQVKDTLRAMDSIDRAAMHKEMIRRQVFTAISVAVAMTLPKIAPRIFKINLAQVLSLSFWKSSMEFVTVLIQ